MTSKAAFRVGENHVLTLPERILAYMAENGFVLDVFAETLSLACVAIRMGPSAIVIEKVRSFSGLV